MMYPLRPGKIIAEGWLRDQLIRSRDGMGGHLDELEPAMIRDPYVSHSSDEGWDPAVRAGWGAEISGNYWFGAVCLAFALDDPLMKEKVEKWVNGTLQNREPGGYMGTYTPEDNRMDDYNAWGTACGMRAMLLYYEGTGRREVLEAVRDCMLWFCENWKENKTRYAGPYIIETMLWCYRLCGEERLLEFAKGYQSWLCENDLFENSKNAYLAGTWHYNSNHTSAYANMVRLPGELYPFTGDPTDLLASVRGVELLREHSVHITGAPCCNYEYLSPRDLNGDSEYCSFTFMHSTYAVMAGLTGRAEYGDDMEELVFNAAEGARRKDEKSIGYMTSPNQTFISRHSSSYTGNPHALYAPVHPVSCCVVNSVTILPDYIRNMAQTDGKGLYIFAYGPSTIRYNGLTLREDTLYPFRQEIVFTAEGEGETELFLKVPRWANDWTLLVNGAGVTADRNAEGFVSVTVHAGDRLELHFDAKPEAVLVDDRDASDKRPVSFRYGPLVFALHIKEAWHVEGDEIARTPLPDGWHWWGASPDTSGAPARPAYEWQAYAKQDIWWNVAVDEQRAGENLRVVEREPDGYVWEHPPVLLEVDAYKAPYLIPPYPDKTFELYGDRQIVTKPLRLTLEPFGATNLRVAYFPRADLPRISEGDALPLWPACEQGTSVE